MKSPVRLDKLLANLGYGSRREVQQMVKEGRVQLAGAPCKNADAPVSLLEAPSLTIDEEALDPLPGILLVLNKPLGFTCSHREEGDLVYDLLPERWRSRNPAISTVGRLDKDTSGLLLLTDDGSLLHRLTSPKAMLEKNYFVRLERPLQGNEAELFSSGEFLLRNEEEPLLPARFFPRGEREGNLILVEGRYHQVRRMFAATGNHVQSLHRQSIGGLTLPADLNPGEFRLLRPEEQAALFSPPSE